MSKWQEGDFVQALEGLPRNDGVPSEEIEVQAWTVGKVIEVDESSIQISWSIRWNGFAAWDFYDHDDPRLAKYIFEEGAE